MRNGGTGHVPDNSPFSEKWENFAIGYKIQQEEE